MHAFSPEFLEWPKYDPAAAAALLRKAGYKGEVIKLQTNKRTVGMYDSAVMIQAMLSAVGLNVQLEVLDWSAQLDNYVNGRFDPLGARARREAQQKAAHKLKLDQQQLDAEIALIVQKHKKLD